MLPEVGGSAAGGDAMNEQERVQEMEALLQSARAICRRHGELTAWERFDASIAKLGIGSITARTYRVLPSDLETITDILPQDENPSQRVGLD